MSTEQFELTDVWSHAGIQSGDHGLHRVFSFVQDCLYNRVTCYSLKTQRGFNEGSVLNVNAASISHK